MRRQPTDPEDKRRRVFAIDELDTQVRMWCFEWGLSDYKNVSTAYRARVNLYLRFGLHKLHSPQVDFDMALSLFYAVVERSSRISGEIPEPELCAACIIYVARLYNYTHVSILDANTIANAYVRAIEPNWILDAYRTIIEEYQSVFFIDVLMPPKKARRSLPS